LASNNQGFISSCVYEIYVATFVVQV